MNFTLNDILTYSTEELLEYDRRDKIRKYRSTQRLCLDMGEQIKAELVVDNQRLGRDARSCLKAFYTLFELVIRDLGGATDRYNDPNRHAPAPDWFEVARQRSMGTAQKGIDGSGRKDEPREVGFQHIPDQEPC